jgi:hypothetical protein
VHIVGFKQVGPPNTPQEIKRLRRENMDMCRRLGQPVVWRHQFNNDDLLSNYTLTLEGVEPTAIAVKKCPACYDTLYEQVRNDCPVCFSVGFVSEEDDPTKWINTSGRIVTSDPGTGVNAPLYGGYGPSVLTWMMEPDISVDVFRINQQGVLVKTQNAQGYAPWYPFMGDNDLIINVTLLNNGSEIDSSNERYQLKMVQPVTVRGWGKRTRGDEHQVAQSFEMSRVPENNILFQVPSDVIIPDSASTRATATPSADEVFEDN